jgi:hypothetical protein
MKSPLILALSALALLLGSAGARAADAEQPRLKYRVKGPVCSCASGLGEDEIRKAWEARFAQPDDARSEKPETHHETRDQEKEKGR